MLANSTTTYGAVTKTFHWLTALLILTLIPLGIIANKLPYDSGEALATKAWVFSLHKTLGLVLLVVAILRILWALSQPKPGLLNADNKMESTLAEIVHWTLYSSLIIVPLTGWASHAAAIGFAPIWWPFGQGLPFIPKDDTLSHNFAMLHIVFERVLAVSVLLHIAGALKHHFIDKDVTLRRMLPGLTEPDSLPTQQHSFLPIFGAAGAYVLALGIGVSIGLFEHTEKTTPTATPLNQVKSGWQVQEGILGITVRQMGSDVHGNFSEWAAAINFSETPDADGRHGNVEVKIAVSSLTLGAVTSQALGPEFLNIQEHPTAIFKADIYADGPLYVAKGILDLHGTQSPIDLPFSLKIEDDIAAMEGETRLVRTDFNIGEKYPDESSVGFDVAVKVTLTAKRQK